VPPVTERTPRSAFEVADPRILMAASLAAFFIAVIALLAVGASAVVVSLVGAAFLIGCALSCAWAWRVSVRQARALEDAVRALADSRDAAKQQSAQTR
jgi:Flp pilus assembly protein TadB